jgi:hypothetical protein
MMSVRLVAVGVFLAFAGYAQAETCLTYTSPVNLEGTLVRKTFAGPPNYEDVRTGDRAETYWLLRLQEHICVAGRRIDAGIDAAQSSVTEVQLVLTAKQYRSYRNRIGKRVRVSGMLFGAHTGHHHTPVLLEAVQFH